MCTENSQTEVKSESPATAKEYFMQGHEPSPSEPEQQSYTKLAPDEEAKFQSWIKSTPWHSEFKQKYGEEPNLDVTNYDYRAAWKAGVEPQKYIDGTYHWGSTNPKTGEMLKSSTHPTAWKQYAAEKGYDVDKLGIKENDPASMLDVLKNK